MLQDLIPLIIECGAHWWPRDLANLCRVSAAWLYPARRTLYNCPRLTGYRACSLLARSVTEDMRLQSLVKGVCLCPMPDYSNCTTQQASSVDSLRTLLAIDGLRSITLGGELSIAAERFLHMVTNPGTVINLRIDGGLMFAGTFRSGPSLTWDESIGLKFGNLRSLDLSNLVLDIDIDMSVYEYSSMIRTLVVDNVELCHGHLVSLAGSAGVVEHLSVTASNASEYDEEIREMLGLCGVRSLTYKVMEKHGSSEALFVEPLPTLRWMETEGVNVDRAMVAALCPGLERLEVVGIDSD